MRFPLNKYMRAQIVEGYGTLEWILRKGGTVVGRSHNKQV